MPDRQVDVALLVALQEEFEGIATALHLAVSPPRLGSEGTEAYHEFSFLDWLGRARSGVATCFGDMGPDTARAKTDRLLREYDADLVISVGLSGQLSADARLGDVVVADSTDHYAASGKVVRDGNDWDVLWAGSSAPTDAVIVRYFRGLCAAEPDAFDAWKRQASLAREPLVPAVAATRLRDAGLLGAEPQLLVGPLTTGPFVVASQAFKRALLRRNRKFLAVDMESSGIGTAASDRAHPIRLLVVRGISDPSDERKNEIEAITSNGLRRWAMANALGIVAIALRARLTFAPEGGEAPVTSRAAAEAVHAVSRRHLPERFRDRPSAERLAAYERFFGYVAQGPSGAATGGFEALAAYVARRDANTVHVAGTPGTGKTAFLAMAYWYLYERSLTAGSEPLPAYLDLGAYDGGGGTPDLSAMESDLRPLTEWIRAADSPGAVIMLDGIQLYRPRPELESRAFDIGAEGRDTRVLGISYPDEISDAPRPFSLPGMPTSQGAIQLLSLATDSAKLADAVDAFLKAQPSSGLPQELSVYIRRFKLKEVDTLLLSLILAEAPRSGGQASRSLSDLLRRHCESWALPRRASIDQAAALAYRYYIERQDLTPAERASREWRLCNLHSTVRDYLLAHYVVQRIENADPGRPGDLLGLSHVYPHRVNRFCRELINVDQSRQRKVFDLLKSLDPASNRKLMTHVCYLAGRIESAAESRDIVTTLKRLLVQEDATDGDNDPERLLYLRTLFISLAYLGDEASAHRYIELLSRNPRWDEINRGFHLEYYGDILYDPRGHMSHVDDLRPFERTYAQLSGRCESRLQAQQRAAIDDVEVFTLYSLAFHRHAAHRLDPAVRRSLLASAPRFVESGSLGARTATFVKAVERTLRQERFSLGLVAERMYRMKSTKRRGWVKRKVRNPESVADHSFGAFLLGLLLLPERSDSEGYSKEKILRMLLIHDLAESETGDLLPSEKTQKEQEEEANWFAELAFVGLLSGAGDLASISALWHEFAGGDTANARIAGDLDKLDNLMQLYVYRRRGPAVPGFTEWRANLLSKVQTAEGLAIQQLIEDHFSR